MARSEHLPIYKASYDLCLYFEQVVRNFSRYHKYSLGGDLRDGARSVLNSLSVLTRVVIRRRSCSKSASRSKNSRCCCVWGKM
jgi:hypothetical protein